MSADEAEVERLAQVAADAYRAHRHSEVQPVWNAIIRAVLAAQAQQAPRPAGELRAQALVAGSKAMIRARGADGSWRLDLIVDAVLAVTEADKAAAVAQARREASGGGSA